MLAQAQRLSIISYEHRNDLRCRITCRKAKCPQALSYVIRRLVQILPLLLEIGNQVESGVDRAQNRGRQTSRINKTSTAIDQVIAHLLRTGNIRTKATQGFAESTHDHMDRFASRQAHSLHAHQPRAMSLVDEQASV